MPSSYPCLLPPFHSLFLIVFLTFSKLFSPHPVICCDSSSYLSITPDPDFLQSFRSSSLHLFHSLSFLCPQTTQFPFLSFLPIFFIFIFLLFSVFLSNPFVLTSSTTFPFSFISCFSTLVLSSSSLYLDTTSIFSSVPRFSRTLNVVPAQIRPNEALPSL